HMINEGFLEEALQKLESLYPTEKQNVDYLMLLGKAAARKGDMRLAVGAYKQVYRLTKKRKEARRALFSAAFLNYQYEDYDGGYRLFQEFLRRFPRRSSMKRDALWYLSWILYLKGDFLGAEEQLLSLYKGIKEKKWYGLPEDKVLYWLGMSLLRQQKFSKARAIFYKLAQNKLIPYYSVLAFYRLKNMPSSSLKDYRLSEAFEHKDVLREIQSLLPAEILDSSFEDSDEDKWLRDLYKGQFDENESDLEEEVPPEEGLQERVVFYSPHLRSYLQRAEDLIQIGDYNWATTELFEVERRTQNPQYLYKIMEDYEKIGAHKRAAYVATISFRDERKKWGVKKSRFLWEKAYPQAYRKWVKKYAQKFGVSPLFVWSIIRAESFFKEDVVSPVGAVGLMQIMPQTARKLSELLGKPLQEGSLKDPEVNIKLGTRYLKRLLQQFKGQIPLVAAAYNGGPHRVNNWLHRFGYLEMDEFIEHIPFLETRNYVKKVTRNFAVYNELYTLSNSYPLERLVQAIEVDFPSALVYRESW
ncbi:MAG: lytic murein transglycosylase, partial [Bdellovibrio sp.]